MIRKVEQTVFQTSDGRTFLDPREAFDVERSLLIRAVLDRHFSFERYTFETFAEFFEENMKEVEDLIEKLKKLSEELF